MPALNGDSKVKVADRKLKCTVGENVKELAQIPELWDVRQGRQSQQESCNLQVERFSHHYLPVLVGDVPFHTPQQLFGRPDTR